MFKVAINPDGTSDCFLDSEDDMSICFSSNLELSACSYGIYPNETAKGVMSIEGLIVLRDFLTKVIDERREP